MSKMHPGMISLERGSHADDSHDDTRQSDRRVTRRKTPIEQARHEALAAVDVAAHAAAVAEGEMKVVAERRQREAENTLSVLGMVAEADTQKFRLPEQEFKYLVDRYEDLGTQTKAAGGPTPDQQQRMRTLRERIDKILPKIAKRELLDDLTIASPEIYKTLLELRLHEIEEQESELDDLAPELLERDLIQEKLALLKTKMNEDILIPPAELARREKLKAVTRAFAETQRDLKNALLERSQLSWYQWGKRKALNDRITDLTHMRDEQELLRKTLNQAPRSRVNMALQMPEDAIENMREDEEESLLAAK